jgi:hypothetical protein
MDQTLDLQVAALIFLAGTRCLVTSELAADVETMSDNEELDEPAPISPFAIELSHPRPNPSEMGL